jgi:glycosyltransferase involved in cell wall biosynthesis
VRQDWRVKTPPSDQIRVMRIIARMNMGGPAVQISGLMRGFNTVEFDHRLYTGFCGSNEADYLDSVAKDVKAIRIEGFGRRISLLGDIKAFVTLIKEIRSFKPHVIHTHTAKAGFLGRIASVFSLHPSIRVHTFHGHLLNGYFGQFKRTLVVTAEKTLALVTDQLLAVGDKVRQDLLQAGVGKRETFGLMRPGLAIHAIPDKKTAREALGLNTNQLQCAFIGRVTQIKRPDRFLDVVSEIRRRRVDLGFFIAGDGELLEYSKRRICAEALSINVLGWQSDIEKVLAASDIIVLTSDNEGTPLSLIQAGMAGLPVVTTNVGSVPEVVVDGMTGIITSLNVNQIANALEMLANDNGLRDSLGAAARAFTLANFSVSGLVHDHEELYKQLLTDRAKS